MNPYHIGIHNECFHSGCDISHMNSWVLFIFGIVIMYHKILMDVWSKFTPYKNSTLSHFCSIKFTFVRTPHSGTDFKSCWEYAFGKACFDPFWIAILCSNINAKCNSFIVILNYFVIFQAYANVMKANMDGLKKKEKSKAKGKTKAKAI